MIFQYNMFKNRVREGSDTSIDDTQARGLAHGSILGVLALTAIAVAACSGKQPHVMSPSDHAQFIFDNGDMQGSEKFAGCRLQYEYTGYRTPFSATMNCPNGGQYAVEAMCVNANDRLIQQPEGTPLFVGGGNPCPVEGSTLKVYILEQTR